VFQGKRNYRGARTTAPIDGDVMSTLCAKRGAVFELGYGTGRNRAGAGRKRLDYRWRRYFERDVDRGPKNSRKAGEQCLLLALSCCDHRSPARQPSKLLRTNVVFLPCGSCLLGERHCAASIKVTVKPPLTSQTVDIGDAVTECTRADAADSGPRGRRGVRGPHGLSWARRRGPSA
jgi:hypothetical protein